MRKFYLFIVLSIIVSSCSNYTQPDVIEYELQNVDTITNNTDIVYQPTFIENYNISEDGKDFIKHYEKCTLVAYKDGTYYSIGYGHNGPDVKYNMTITQSQANNYFDNDIKWVEEYANKMIDDLPYEYNFSQGFIDGLCSLIYNAGGNGIRKSEFYNRLKKCRVTNGIMDISDYNYTIAAVKTTRISHPGHHKRRFEEHKMMLN